MRQVLAVGEWAKRRDGLLEQTLRQLVFMSLLLLGMFNDFALIDPHSAMFRSPSQFLLYLTLVPFGLSIAVFGVKSRRYSVRLEHYLLALFVAWTMLSFFANWEAIAYLAVSGANGAQTYFDTMRFIVLMAICCVVISYVFADDRSLLAVARQGLVWSFILIMPYVLVEFLAKFLFYEPAQRLLAILDVYFHARRGQEYTEIFRLRGLAFEPSFFAAYLCVVFPWLLARSHDTGRMRDMTLVVLALACVVFSRSRTAYVAIPIEILCYLFIARGGESVNRRRAGRRRWTIGILGALLLVISTWVSHDANFPDLLKIVESTPSLLNWSVTSNFTRIGSQEAALRIAVQHPIFGVGPGLSGAYLEYYYPQYIYAGSEVMTWIAGAHRDFSAPAFGLFAQVAAEWGLVGLMIYLALWYRCLAAIRKVVSTTQKKYGLLDADGVALYTSIVGVLVASFGLNGVIFTGYWMLLILAFTYIQCSYRPRI